MPKPVKIESQLSGSTAQPLLPAKPALPGSPDAIPDYIADLCGGLIKLAEAAKLDMLAYLLGMAQIEAEAASRQSAKRAAR